VCLLREDDQFTRIAMVKSLINPGWRSFWLGGFLTVGTVAAGALGQTPRIHTEVSSSQMTTLKSFQPSTQGRVDAGRMAANAKLNGVSIVFNRSAGQQADLEALIAAQQDPNSPLYHKWLTPDEFAARFGMAQADIDKVQGWLQRQGFQVDSVARSRNAIRFSGTAGQVEQAFQTELHYYQANGRQEFAPSKALSVPSALAPVIESVRNLTSFRPRPMHVPPTGRPAFTSSQTGSVFFAPGDIKVAYDVNPLYSGGIDGSGQSISVIGQSAISVSDIENFQNAAGLPQKDPTLVLVPGTGSSTVASGGDEGESDLDVEWSGAMAPGADILFVYSGSSTNFNAFDAMQYAVDERLSPIISISYGACETALNGFSLESVFQQAATQGQTIIAASGDEGATGCSGDTNGLTIAQQFALAVDYPASSPFVTAVGGTEITAANSVSTNSTYWAAQGSSDILSSAKTYIPEIAWNDNSSQFGLSSSGGGPSALFAKPSWQTGVAGIPSDSKRDVPDVALYSSPGFPGYLFCTSDQSDWNTTSPPLQQASCNSGFRDSASQDLTVAGGTSFAAPIFAGMIALINQKRGYVSGQGLINSTLYTLASNSTTYASAFHDVTTGNNKCNAGSTYCGTTTGGYSAGTGYDQVTGLGSVDANNLASAWPASTTTLIGTTTAVTATSASLDVNTNDTFTITVTSNSGSSTPTGTLRLDVDGGSSAGGTTVANQSLTANGTFAYTTQFATAGTHQVVALYSGDTTHAASTGVISVTVSGTSSGTGSFTVAGTNVTVTQGSAASSTITVTPKTGYTGTVYLTFATSNDSALTNLCYSFTTMLSNGDGSVAVTGTSPVTTQLQFDTKAADCASSAAVGGTGSSKGGTHTMHRVGGPLKTSQNKLPINPVPGGVALAGLALGGLIARSRKLRALAGVILLGSIGLGLSACGGGSGGGSGSTVPNPPKGSYTITLTGTDSAKSTITAQTTFSLVIQ
jgi:subtilase family serine protease